MKIICFNTWAGMAGMEGVLAFFQKYQDTDVFCLQEIWNGGEEAKAKTAAGRSLANVDADIFNKIKNALPDHTPFFTPYYVPYFGVALFVRKTLTVTERGEQCVYREPGYVSPTEIADHARTLQSVTVETPNGPLTVCNVHAAWKTDGKGDTPDRLDQSRRIIEYLKAFDHPTILCGDFNLLPDTESMKQIEVAGFENLIRTHGVTSTRTHFYTGTERFADYIFVSNGLTVVDFRVLPEEVSDHAALFVEAH